MSSIQSQNSAAAETAMNQTKTTCSDKFQIHPGRKSDKKILLVDDEDDILDLVETFLTECGFSVSSFKNGLDAVHCFVEKQHDLVLTDINMPGITGIILADYIKSQDSQVPVFAVTDNDFLAEGLFDEVIVKPLDLNLLLLLIQSYLMEDCLHS